MRKVIAIVFAIFICCGADCFAQGKVTRPTRQQTQTSKPKKTSPKMSVSGPDGYISIRTGTTVTAGFRSALSQNKA